MRTRELELVRTLLAVGALLVVASPPSLTAIAAEQLTPEQRQLFITGARLWPVYCAQCHNARPGSQFSPAQWDAITMHMRTQSIMPAKNMRAIKKFLQEAR
jgi:mono/diheme cytochrome c family protein